MKDSLIDHFYIASTIFFFTADSQLIMRWQVKLVGSLPDDFYGKIFFTVKLLINPWVLSGVVATFFAGVSWLLTMANFDISYAYPFISRNYLIVLA
ncbi:MAG: hypothetical protein ACUVQ3_09190 [bacterium]